MLYPIELRGRRGRAVELRSTDSPFDYAQGKRRRLSQHKQKIGVGNGNRTRNRRSHSPVLCQLSYSHRNLVIIAIASNLDRHAGDKLEGPIQGWWEPNFSGRLFTQRSQRALSELRGYAVELCQMRPMPTYSNPSARSRVESSRFLVSTMTGFLSRCLMRSKSSARNSGQPVPTTRASPPSAAA
jgi:hypothetical protein